MLRKTETIKSLMFKLFETSNFIILIGVLSILPFLVISIFNNPSADDFCYNVYTRDLGYLNTQLEAYNNWSGRYFSTAIISISAFVSGSFYLYKSFPLILFFLFFISLYHLFSSIFNYVPKKLKLAFVFLIVVLYLLQIPSTSEGFYWLAGSVTYQLSIILSVFLFSFLIKFLNTSKKRYLIVSMFLSFLVMGSNEISLMFVDLIVGVIFLYTSFIKYRINYSIFGLLIFMVVCTAFVVLSPGSASRVTTYPGNQQFLYSFFKTLNATKSHLGDWLPSIIITFFVFFDYLDKNISIQIPQIFNVKLLIPFVIVFSFPLIGVFPVYYSLKWVPYRSLNLIYFFFLMGLMYLGFVLYFKLKIAQKEFLVFSKWTKIFLFIIIFIRLGGNNNIRIAYSDLISGRAYAYNAVLTNRYKIIHESKSQVLVFPALTNLPKTIFFEDIKDNPNHWINQCYRSYFDKKEIKVNPN